MESKDLFGNIREYLIVWRWNLQVCSYPGPYSIVSINLSGLVLGGYQLLGHTYPTGAAGIRFPKTLSYQLGRVVIGSFFKLPYQLDPSFIQGPKMMF